MRRDPPPFTIDLLVRAQANAEREVVWAALVAPADTLALAKSWTPEVDTLCREFWAEFSEKRDEILQAKDDIDAQINAVLGILASDRKFYRILDWLPSPERCFSKDAINEGLSDSFYLRAARRGLPRVMRIVEKELGLWMRI